MSYTYFKAAFFYELFIHGITVLVIPHYLLCKRGVNFKGSSRELQEVPLNSMALVVQTKIHMFTDMK